MKRIFISILFTLALAQFKAQNVAACNAAQPVCNNPNFNFTAGGGFGLTAGLNVSNPSTNPQGVNSGCLLSNGPNPQWLILNVSGSGNLGFSFGAAGSPNPQLGFYDWAMWPYTPSTCTNIFNNTLPPVACNWNAQSSGGTGMGTVPAGGNAGNFQPSIPVVAGQQYLICISNWSGVNTAVTFSNTGTANLSCNMFTATSSTICNGSSAVITGTTNLTGVSYTLIPGPIIQPNLSFTVSPGVTTVYTVTATGTDPQSNVVTTLTTTATITVITPTISVNTASSVCNGGSVNLTANTTGATSYSWNGPGAYTNATQNPVLVGLTAASAGVYTVMSTLPTGTLNCFAFGTTTVNVVTTSSITVNPTSTTVCQGDPVTLTASAVGANAWLWNGPLGFTDVNANTGFAGSIPTQSGTYSVTASFILGTLTCTATNSINVTVNPKLFFNLAPIPNVCNGQQIFVPGPAGATSYLWTGPNSYTANTQNLSINNAVAQQSGWYVLNVSMGNCATKDSVMVFVLSPISFSLVPQNPVICEGDSVNMNTLVIGGTGIFNYSWYPTTGLIHITGPTTIGSPTATTVYTITSSDAACPTVTIATSFILTVNPKPKPNLWADKIKGCVPLCLNMKSNSAPQSVNVSWDFGNGLRANGDSIHFCFDQAGSYSITTSIVDVNGCKSRTTAPFTIDAYPRPLANFSWDPAIPSLIENEIKFYSSYVNGPINYYHWDFGDVNDFSTDTSSFKNPTHLFNSNIPGIYPVTLIETNNYGCSDTIVKMVAIEEDFTLYIPNTFTPNGDGFNDSFFPKGMGFKTDSYEMLIFDRWGNVIFKSNDVYKGWDGTIKGVTAPADVYVYKIKCTGSAHGSKKDVVGHVTLLK